MTLKELDEKEVELRNSIASAVSKEKLAEIENEINGLQEQRKNFNEQKNIMEERLKKMTDEKLELKAERKDKYDSVEYRKAFMDFCQKGIKLPMEFRDDAVTTTTTASATIPTTLLNELVKESKTFGEIFARVRKLNIKGGVKVPIVSIKPTASWIGETTSEDKNITANTSVAFSYHTLEIKIAQSLLASAVTYDAFQNEFVSLAREAIDYALDNAIINGTGDDDDMPLGIINDSRVSANNKITMTKTQLASWSDWKTRVFAKMKKSYRNGLFIMAQGTFDAYIDGMTDEIGQPIGRVNYGISGGETYRFGGKEVLVVEDEILDSADSASNGDVIGIFVKLDNYAINSNMELRSVSWVDEDTNKTKIKMQLIADGKLLDATGVLLIKLSA